MFFNFFFFKIFLYRRFNNEYCPSLKGKPKFFIIQACRGDDYDYGIEKLSPSPVDVTDAMRVSPSSIGSPPGAAPGSYRKYKV